MNDKDSLSNNDIGPSENNNIECNIREEYDSLDFKLNEINSALDVIEQRNDDIHGKLKELLQSSIEIRQELRNQTMQTEERNVEQKSSQ